MDLCVLFCVAHTNQMLDESCPFSRAHLKGDVSANGRTLMITHSYQFLHSAGIPQPTETHCRRSTDALIGVRQQCDQTRMSARFPRAAGPFDHQRIVASSCSIDRGKLDPLIWIIKQRKHPHPMLGTTVAGRVLAAE